MISPDGETVQTHLSTLLGANLKDYWVDPEPDPEDHPEKPWAPYLDYAGEQAVYVLPKKRLPKVFWDATYTCYGAIYIVTATGTTDMRKLMRRVRDHRVTPVPSTP